ncbi:MAG: FIST N-terminal domain-containing protein [Polaribacter sp.]
MKIVQLKKEVNSDFKYISEPQNLKFPLVLVFGSRLILENETIFYKVKSLFPDGHIVFGSTAGTITSKTVDDTSVVITAIEFERSTFIVKKSTVLSPTKNIVNSINVGRELISKFPTQNLKHIFIVSEGSFINGSQLTVGLNSVPINNLRITGALCGDASRFEKTLCSYNEAPKEGEVIAIGFYGDRLEVTSASNGGWIPFGPTRKVTKSKENILYQIDDKPALDLYKKYLGDKSKELPAAALLFPLSVTVKNSKKPVTRTILSIDEKNSTMLLAGEIPEGSSVQLMMTNVDQILSASESATQKAINQRKNNPELAILVSCIGRKLVLDQRVEEEVEEVQSVVGNTTFISGLYSYGEIAPFDDENECQLHNQTIAVTLISE